MKRHTPGPWIIETDQNHDGSHLYVIDVEHNDLVADCSGFGCLPPFEEAVANARLIAAAPELLAACEAAVVAIEAEKKLNACWGRAVAIEIGIAANAALKAIAKAGQPATGLATERFRAKPTGAIDKQNEPSE